MEDLEVHIKRLFCGHIYKETEVEFLEHETRLSSAGGMVEVDNYERNAHHRTCIKCGKHKIKVIDKLVHKVNVNEQIKQWREEDANA